MELFFTAQIGTSGIVLDRQTQRYGVHTYMWRSSLLRHLGSLNAGLMDAYAILRCIPPKRGVSDQVKITPYRRVTSGRIPWAEKPRRFPRSTAARSGRGPLADGVVLLGVKVGSRHRPRSASL